MAASMPIERDLSGTVLAGRYRVLSQIGGGGMGTVHAGEHIEVGRKVAIKILLPEAVRQPALVERFRREARLTARVEHEHVVECLDAGVSDDGLCFYVMEWLRGEDLHALLRRERTLPWPRARAIVAQVCRALAAAHAQGVVHRDLKPGNIFLVKREDNPDFVKVLDFGIAKLLAPDEAAGEVLTRIGEVVGTTPYMAPEMAAGEAFDHRIDVYAAGVILYQALCGRLPFRGKTPRQILTAIIKAELPRLSTRNPGLVASPGLEALLARALHRRRWPLVLVGVVALAAAGVTWAALRGSEPAPELAGAERVSGPPEVAVAEQLSKLPVVPVVPVGAPPGPVVEESVVAEVEAKPGTVEPEDVADASPRVESAEADTKVEAKERKGEPRSDFGDVMRRAGSKVRRCLAQAGIKAGTRVRFDIVVEARTGRITDATPRDPHRGKSALGDCVVEPRAASTVRPAPANEWRRSHEFSS